MTLFHDLQYAVRTLRHSPAVTVMTVLMLALGIGANTAIFSVVYGALLRPLPFPGADDLVVVYRLYPSGDEWASNSVPRFVFWRANNDALEQLAAHTLATSGFNLLSDGPPERLLGTRVSFNFFSVFATPPVLGRDFVAADDRPGAARVVVLSDRLWRRQFGSDPGIVGATVVLNDAGHEVVGVAPPGFDYPERAELWTPIQLDPGSRERANYLTLVGRLRDDRSFEQAQAAMTVLARQHYAMDPEIGGESENLVLRPLGEHLYGQLRTSLLVLLGAVGFVLLIACVNVANLQLARSTVRQKEIALRTVLGASGGRIVRQLLTESVLLAAIGGAVGVVLAWWLVPTLVALGPASLRQLGNLGLDVSVLLFAAAVSLVTGIVFGLVPALQAVHTDLNDPLKEGSTRVLGSRGSGLTRQILVVSEVALALVLMIGAALLIRSFAGLRATDPGFHADRVLTAKLVLPEARFRDATTLDMFNRRIVDEIAAVPGVESAAIASSLPLELGPDLPFIVNAQYVEGSSTEGVGDAQYRAVSPGYFGTLEIPLVRGRAFTRQDVTGTPGVVVVNEALAARHWPGTDPIGQLLTIGPPYVPELADPAPRQVVGVVRDVREMSLDADPPQILYVPLAQIPQLVLERFMQLMPENVIVRTAVDPASVTIALQEAVWAVEPTQPVSQVLTMDQIVTRSLGSAQFNMLLLGMLSAVALLLAAVGIYGVLSFLVGQRTREIGVRMALGATRTDVERMVVRQSMTTIAAGVAVGLAGAFALTRLLASLVHGVSVLDPATFVVSPLILLAVALVATYLPARRAAALDPAVALKNE